MKSSTAWILFCVIAFLVVICSIDEESAEKPYEPGHTDAYVMAKQLVEKQLKAPSTAEFASYSESTIKNIGTDTWEVTSYVDSQNSFGAMIRTQFTITMMVNKQTKRWMATKIDTEP